MRKTETKRALDAGCPPAYVAQLMGHKNVASLQNYADADVNVQRAVSSSAMTGQHFEVTNKMSKFKESTSTVACPQGGQVVINIASCTNVYINK